MIYINVKGENILMVCNGVNESEISFYNLNDSPVFLKRFTNRDEILLNNKLNKLEFITNSNLLVMK